MNGYKAGFVGLGAIYFILFIWGLLIPSGGAMIISFLGMLWCGLGWSVTDRLLCD